MNSGQLDMLHYGRNKRISAVGNGVRLGLDSIFQESVDQNGAFGRYIYGSGNVVF